MQLNTVAEENKEQCQLIETLYQREQSMLKEIKYLTRALELRTDDLMTTDQKFKRAADPTNVLTGDQVTLVVQAQLNGLKNANAQLKQEVQELQQIREFNNRELLDLEY